MRRSRFEETDDPAVVQAPGADLVKPVHPKGIGGKFAASVTKMKTVVGENTLTLYRYSNLFFFEVHSPLNHTWKTEVIKRGVEITAAVVNPPGARNSHAGDMCGKVSIFNDIFCTTTED